MAESHRDGDTAFDGASGTPLGAITKGGEGSAPSAGLTFGRLKTFMKPEP